MYGFYRVGVANIYTKLSEASENVLKIINLIDEVVKNSVSIIVFPELTLTGYTLNDIFFQYNLYNHKIEL